jgi:Flp pilus assembly secretin CpaC
MSARISGLFLLVTLGLGLGLGPAAAAGPARRYVAVDKSLVMNMPQRLTKVSLANPVIADVVVINPTQLVVNGKAAGVTSLVVFYPQGMDVFELVVHPAASSSLKTTLKPAEAHQITVQRGDKITNHLFVPSEERVWVELESSKVEPEPPKK